MNDLVIWICDFCWKYYDSGCCFGVVYCVGNVVVLCVVFVGKLIFIFIYGINSIFYVGKISGSYVRVVR